MPLPNRSTRRRPARPVRALATAAAAALLVTACDADGGETDGSATTDGGPVASDDAPTEALSVVVTTSILGDVVAEVLGDQGEVTVLMGSGVDPHGYEPSARDGAMLREADLVVANGLQLEESLLSTLEATEQEGVEVFELAPRLDPIEFELVGDDDDGHDDEGEDHGHDDDGDDHDHGPEDPHVWFDPVRMVDGVQQLADALVAAGDVEADAIELRAAAYVEELEQVHADLEQAFAGAGDGERVVITNHDAIGYLAARYDFEVVGTVIPGASTQVETDAQQFADLIEAVEEHEVGTVFAENTDSTTLADQLASEVVGRGDLEVEVVRIATDALDEPGSEADTYLGLLRSTGLAVADSLDG